MPNSLQARAIRTAISPRLAIRIRRNMFHPTPKSESHPRNKIAQSRQLLSVATRSFGEMLPELKSLSAERGLVAKKMLPISSHRGRMSTLRVLLLVRWPVRVEEVNRGQQFCYCFWLSTMPPTSCLLALAFRVASVLSRQLSAALRSAARALGLSHS
jgi:hypothetical protein